MLERRASTLAGLAVAAMGAVPLLWLATTPAPPASPDPLTPDVVPGLEAAPAEIHLATPAPHIAGVSDAVARVLASQGFATSPSTDEIPDSVARVLADHGVTLTVAEER